MQLSLVGLMGLLPAALALTTTTSITFWVPPTQQVPNPNALPPSTHATLSSLHTTYSTPLTAANTFVFRNISTGSYLADFHSLSHAFAPYRVDVIPSLDGAAGDKVALDVKVWETYRGNDWGNKGEEARDAGMGYHVKALGPKGYFMERGSFSVLTILKNPMILMGIVTMAIFFGMPYLVENMDPEMKAEWEERQKENPMNSLLGGGGAQPGANPMGDFDMAAYLAGSKKKEDSGASTPSNNGGGGGGSSSSKKEKGGRR